MARHSREAAHTAEGYQGAGEAPGSQGAANQAGAEWGYPAVKASDYSREAYTGAGRRSRGRRSRGAGRIAARVGIVVAALAVLLAVAVGAYAHEFESRMLANQSTPDDMAQVLQAADESQPYYILFLGSDKREATAAAKTEASSSEDQHSDVIILARVDKPSKQVTLVSIPRDTRWSYEGKVYKINQAYAVGGAALETKAVSELCGVPIAHTVEIHFSGLEVLVDALGGVTVDVPQTINWKVDKTDEVITIEAGEQVLNGMQAQIFARERKSYVEQDSQRQSNVRKLVSAIATGIRNANPVQLPGLGMAIADCVGTDMGLGDIMGLLSAFRGDGFTMYSGSGPSLGEIDYENDGLWLCYENPLGWQRVMSVVEAGGDPSTVDPNEEYENGVSVDIDSYWDPNANDGTAYNYGYEEPTETYYGGYYDEYGNWVE